MVACPKKLNAPSHSSMVKSLRTEAQNLSVKAKEISVQISSDEDSTENIFDGIHPKYYPVFLHKNTHEDCVLRRNDTEDSFRPPFKDQAHVLNMEPVNTTVIYEPT
nr:uncharacterized protein LOC118680908 [Bactrocera oleae]